jgi:hypothetical protein
MTRLNASKLPYPQVPVHSMTFTDAAFHMAVATCNAANCTVVASLSATVETYAECGIPIRDKSGTMIGVTASVGALAILMVFLRLVDRFFSSYARLGWDDLLIGLLGVASLFQNVPVVIGSKKRSGNSLAFGVISKPIDVKIQREASESDVELVRRPPCQ